jgi:hypothetical protein
MIAIYSIKESKERAFLKKGPAARTPQKLLRILTGGGSTPQRKIKKFFAELFFKKATASRLPELGARGPKPLRTPQCL